MTRSSLRGQTTRLILLTGITLAGIIGAATWPATIAGAADSGSSTAMVLPGMIQGSVAPGYDSTCGIKQGGIGYCWGADNYGQLDGLFSTTTHTGSPPGGGVFVQMSVGVSFACGIKQGGTLLCWGRDNTGQVDGVARTSGCSCAVGSPLPGILFSSVSAGGFHACGIAVTDGSAYCWGLDGSGQVDGTPTGATVVGHAPNNNTFVQISAGYAHSCGVTTSGAGVCWGDDANGELNGIVNGATNMGSAPGSTAYRSISAGYYFTCGIRGDGAPLCWGFDGQGQVDGAPASNLVGVPPVSNLISISTSINSGHACGVKTDGTAACWGFNYYGQVNGVPNGTSPYYSVGAPPGGGSYLTIAAGGSHTCGVRAGGSVFCYGYNASGQVTGTPTTGGNHYASGGPSGVFNQPAVASGTSHTCLLKTTGAVTCTGDDSAGQLDGTPGATHTGSPPGGFLYLQVAASGNQSCGVTTSHLLKCWGNGATGLEPTPAGQFLQAAAGDNHVCGLRPNGAAVCWGDEPYSVAGPFVQLSARGNDTCGISATLLATCWGDNSHNQLGLSGYAQSVGISVGEAHVCALFSISFFFSSAGPSCIGDNTYTQASPPAAGTFTVISAGDYHTCLLSIGGGVLCFGKNATGQADSPTGGAFLSVAAGGVHTCAIQDSGVMLCWGAGAGFSPSTRQGYRNLRVHIQGTSTTLTWRGVRGAVGYNVLSRGTALNGALIHGRAGHYRWTINRILRHPTLTLVERFR